MKIGANRRQASPGVVAVHSGTCAARSPRHEPGHRLQPRPPAQGRANLSDGALYANSKKLFGKGIPAPRRGRSKGRNWSSMPSPRKGLPGGGVRGFVSSILRHTTAVVCHCSSETPGRGWYKDVCRVRLDMHRTGNRLCTRSWGGQSIGGSEPNGSGMPRSQKHVRPFFAYLAVSPAWKRCMFCGLPCFMMQNPAPTGRSHSYHHSFRYVPYAFVQVPAIFKNSG